MELMEENGQMWIDYDLPAPFVQLPVQTRLPSAGAALKKGKDRGQKKRDEATKREENKKVRISTFKDSNVTN